MDHFDVCANAHPQFLQAMHFVVMADELVNASAFSGRKELKRQEVGHGRRLLKLSLVSILGTSRPNCNAQPVIFWLS